jgi:hypothetical protein
VENHLAADGSSGAVRAREAQATALAEEIAETADTPLEGERHEEGETKDGSFSKTVREDMLGHRRLQVDARKWLMVKLAPRKYGDKIEHTGKDGGPIQHESLLFARNGLLPGRSARLRPLPARSLRG